MRLFLSHTTVPEDQRTAAMLRDSLRNSGFEIYLVDGGMVSGGDWRAETERAIRGADWFIALVSEHYSRAVSTEFHVGTALALNKPVLTMIIQAVDRMPPGLERFQVIDATRDLRFGAERLEELLRQQSVVDETGQFVALQLENSEYKEYGANRAPIKDERIFIAYSRKQRALAKDLYDLLSKNNKAVFWDDKIIAGSGWRQTIQKALDDATHVIVIWTSDAAQSDEVEREVSYALAAGKIIMPILSREISSLPYHLHGLHYITLKDDVQLLEADLLRALAQYSADKDIWQ